MLRLFMKRSRQEEGVCRLELVQAIAELGSISDLQLVVNLHVESPFPNLLAVMDMLRKHSSLVSQQRVRRTC